MDRASVLSGAPFKSAVIGASLIFALLIFAGAVSFRVVQAAMLGALERQLAAEQLLLADLYRQSGTAGLAHAIEQMDARTEAAPRALGLFGEAGVKLAGNVEAAPARVGVARARLALRPGAEPEGYYVSTAHLDRLVVVVGRSLAPVLAAERALAIVLAITVGVTTLATVAVGYRFSAQSHRKLAAIGDALDQVAGGEMAARLPVGPDNDQIDRIARQINGHLDRLSVLMHSTRTAAAAIAHDLKTPLSRAFLALQEARARIERGEPAEAELDQTERDLDEMNAIFDTMLRVARIEAGSLPAAAPVIDLAPVAADVAETMAAVAEEAGRRLVLETEPGLRAEAHGDARMVGQALVNLIQNAVLHTPSGAVIRVRAMATEEGAVLVVEDDGPGIPANKRGEVLDPFVRLDAARSTRGSGLGLTLVKAIADHHHAALRLEDAGPGLRAVLQFPPV